MGTQGWPSRFVGEPGNVLVGLVELRHGLGSEELFGCDVETVGVALDRLEKPRRWIVELPQDGAGGDGRVVACQDLLQRLGRNARGNRLGLDEAVGVSVADDFGGRGGWRAGRGSAWCRAVVMIPAL
jgi:hypothetical protein